MLGLASHGSSTEWPATEETGDATRAGGGEIFIKALFSFCFWNISQISFCVLSHPSFSWFLNLQPKIFHYWKFVWPMMGWSRRRARGQTDPYVLSLDWAPRLIRQNIRQLGRKKRGLFLNAHAIYLQTSQGKKRKQITTQLLKIFSFTFMWEYGI